MISGYGPSDIPRSRSRSSGDRKTSGTNGKAGQVRDRHEKIRGLIQSKGYVTIEYLAQVFNVTPQTIRRDINTLSEKGSINRYHGGAGISSSTENVAYTERKIFQQLCFSHRQ